ncbi:hypothetical protein H310_14754 [Aphanomyces invadans]|uniref:Uncharacterized protein n=1 Tax=Aphanomyces invadans TaxID=157072 RepID=A0A024T8M3_9STRA|nr:hypothetical protein H310_14754 [Aphanomyces invadans]ETV90475.1 hypothetical protein H310_14754 [Aphanomyces invadans]|eukprot:XP_008880903.1 hypothetical protein H310_14754 [Aphanomyces invadans]
MVGTAGLWHDQRLECPQPRIQVLFRTSGQHEALVWCLYGKAPDADFGRAPSFSAVWSKDLKIAKTAVRQIDLVIQNRATSRGVVAELAVGRQHRSAQGPRHGVTEPTDLATSFVHKAAMHS